MILVTGSNRRRGFSLIEILVVIGLIALAGGLVAINATAILAGLGEDPPEKVFLNALREGRFQAAYEKEATRLRFLEEENQLALFSDTGRLIESFPLNDTDLRISFLQVLPAQGVGRLSREETSPINTIVFRPDRSSTPFIVTYDGPKFRFSQRFDPFSDTVLEDSRNE
jgi:prepilin-type N-terminal cleavage/methylation domain-containing protein